MANAYYHGTRMTNSVDSSTVSSIIDTSPVGIVVTGDSADALLFPLNTAVQVASFDAETYASAGATGTIASVLKSLAAQGNAPLTTIVRVDEDELELETNVLAALELLDDAASEGSASIKLMGAPGLESVAVVNAMAVVCENIGAFSYAAIAGATTMSDAILARDSYGNRNTMLLWPATVTNAGQTVHIAALALGQRATIDDDISIAKTISNVGVSGVDDIGVPMNYRGEQSIANQLNKNHITTIIRKNGFRFWGSRTASTELMYTYESDVRVSHYVNAQFDAMLDNDLDTVTTLEALENIVERGQILLDNLASAEDPLIIDGNCWIKAASNTEAVLASGAANFNYDFGVYKPLEQPGFDGLITNSYLTQVLPDATSTDA